MLYEGLELLEALELDVESAVWDIDVVPEPPLGVIKLAQSEFLRPKIKIQEPCPRL